MNLSALDVGVLELAELVEWLPAGCALWQSMGGPASISLEAEQLRWVFWRLQVLSWQQTEDGTKGRNQPQPPKRLEYADERTAAADADAAKGSAWARRDAMRRAAREAAQAAAAGAGEI